MNALAPAIGHNRPSPHDIASDVIARLNAYLADHPVIENRENANVAAALSVSAGKTIADLDDERRAKVRPLNDQVGAINLAHREAVQPLKDVLDELTRRLTDFAKAEEARLKAEAAAAALAAAEARRAAEEATAKADEARDNAASGEVGLDMAGAIIEQRTAEREAATAERAAARAERDTGVRLHTGFGRAKSLRSHEALTVTDAAAAVADIGANDVINAAIITVAKAFRKLRGRLPAGVVANTERRM